MMDLWFVLNLFGTACFTEVLHLVTQAQLLVTNCYNELTAYTALAYSYWASFHDAYQCQGHAHRQYRLKLPYNSCRTYLPNHMESISYHITPAGFMFILLFNIITPEHTLHSRVKDFTTHNSILC